MELAQNIINKGVRMATWDSLEVAVIQTGNLGEDRRLAALARSQGRFTQ